LRGSGKLAWVILVAHWDGLLRVRDGSPAR
jgi:hypothetical protein